MRQETKQLVATILEAIIASIAIILLFIIVVFATPDQLSGESDWSQEAQKQLEAEGEE